MNKLQGYLVSLRPKTLTASIGPLLLVFAFCYQNNDPSFSSITLMFLLVICTVLMQAGSNFANEYYDYQTGVDKKGRAGPIRSIQSGALKDKDIRNAFLVCFALAFLLGLQITYMSDYKVLIGGLVCLFVAWAYTGGPFPLSHYMLGEVFAFAFFGPVAVLGAEYVLTNSISMECFYLSLLPGSISALLMSVNNLRDWESDKNEKKWTPASVFGQDFGAILSIVFIIFSVLLPFFFSLIGLMKPHFLIFSILIYAVHFKFWHQIYKKENLIECLGATGKYFFIHCLNTAAGVFYL